MFDRARIHSPLATLFGFCAGVAFILACPTQPDPQAGTDSFESSTLGPTTAMAATGEPASCARWEVRHDIIESDDGSTRTIESGWEPFAGSTAYDALIHVISRRCAD